jgi:ribosomal protein L7/L12
MDKVQVRPLKNDLEQKVVRALIYQGKIEAIKLYMEYTDCRLGQAKIAVDKIGHQIEPGQAS